MSKDVEGYKKICKISDLQNKIGKRFMIDDIDVAVFRVDEKVFAVNNICPHQHASIIYDGFVEDGYVICPAHGWEFNLKTGKMHTGGSGLDPYEVKIIDSEVFIKVYENKINWNF